MPCDCFACRSLCLSDNTTDYVFPGGVGGETYFANVCGDTVQECDPEGWRVENDIGVAVQTWGAAPVCDLAEPSTLKCVNEKTGEPECCTKDCAVLGVFDRVEQPVFSLLDDTNPDGGLQLRFVSPVSVTEPTDPRPCTIDPSTGVPYPRVVTMRFLCDANATASAVPYEVIPSAESNCS